MEKTRQLFLMLSRTDTGMARVIRAFSRYPYNHVSLTLDPSLRKWYSFARYVQDAPFYSGFICEPVERFYASSNEVRVRVFRLMIPEERARHLEAMFETAGHADSGLIYNYFDALATVFHASIPVERSHTCLSFACSVLDRHHTSIASLNVDLAPFQFYEGSLVKLVPDSGSREDVYFTSMGFIEGTLCSAKQLMVLTTRLVVQELNSHKAHRFHRTAQ